MDTTAYDDDIAAWAAEQVALLRSGQLSRIDAEHIAQEIEDLANRDRHELSNRFAILLAHLLKWQRQPERRGSSWQKTIRNQRKQIAGLLKATPSLKHLMADPAWQEKVWMDARDKAVHEAGFDYDLLPAEWPWPVEQVQSPDFLPPGGSNAFLPDAGE